MILEGIVTTVAGDSAVNVAPMGPRVEPAMDRFVLRPFRSAVTYVNLLAHPEGVFHVTDDVLLLARAAVGELEPLPRLVRAERVRGWVLAGACRWYEFRIVSRDESGERAALTAEVVHTGRGRDFFGFNRAKHAVVEAAILATRVHLLPAADIAAEFERLRVLVAKTGGPQEAEAFAFLQDYVARFSQRACPPGAQAGKPAG
jgi:hypothetical protein